MYSPISTDAFFAEKSPVQLDAEILDALKHELAEELDSDEDEDEFTFSSVIDTAPVKQTSRPPSRLRHGFTSDDSERGDASETSDNGSIKPRKKRRLSPGSKSNRNRSISPAFNKRASGGTHEDTSSESVNSDFDDLARQLMDDDWE
jgi:hypothetical protein